MEIKEMFRNRIHNLLRLADTRGSAGIILAYVTHNAKLLARQC